MHADEYAMIHLADDEWGNDTMLRVAREFFAAHSECQFVMVYEHAGWFLGWRRDETCWTTANDMAVLQQPRPQPKGCGYVVRRGPQGADFPNGYEYSMHTGQQMRLVA